MQAAAKDRDEVRLELPSEPDSIKQARDAVAVLAERIGVPADALSRYKLPTPAVIVGPVDDNDEPLPRSIKGWDPADVDEWDAGRQKRAPRGR